MSDQYRHLCGYCGTEFTSPHQRHSFCSRACRQSHKSRPDVSAVDATSGSRVYVVGTVDAVKIGTSTQLATRIGSLQHMSPVSLTLLAHFEGSYGTEQWLHGRFHAYRTHGEWFRREGELAAWVDCLVALMQAGGPTRSEALESAGAKLRHNPRRPSIPRPLPPGQPSAWEPGPKRSRGIVEFEARRVARKLKP